jgi:adenosylcobinamide-GDP ribazoletransferase
MGVWSELDTKSIEVLCIGFVLSRAFSGLAVVTFSCAKDSGLAKAFSDAAQKRVVQLCMVSYMVLIACFMIYFGRILGIVAIVGAICTFAYYRYVAYKEFGGITGDLAGWFLQLCELVMAIVVLILQVV